MLPDLPSIESLIEEFLNLPYDKLQSFVTEMNLTDPQGLTEVLKDPEVQKRVADFKSYEARAAAEIAAHGQKLWN